MSRDRPLYSFVLIVGLSCICAWILTYVALQRKHRIEANMNYARVHALADALGLITPGMHRRAVLDAYEAHVTRKKLGGMTVWEARKDGRCIGYAVQLEGRGKFGPIKGIVAFTPDKQRIKALRIYRQQETPGLGGRIASRKWLSQFNDLPMVVHGTPGIVINSNAKGPNVVDGITGASETVHTMSELLNTVIARFLAGGVLLHPLNLHLDADAVTRATPGYPRNLKKPPNLRKEVRRNDFMVPEGTVDLALHKKVTSSMKEEPIIGDLSQIVDGDKKSGDFDYVEMDPGPQWVQIDLGRVCTLYCIVIWHYYKNPVIYKDVIVQISNDPKFKKGVKTLFNNDYDNSTGLGKGSDPSYFARWWGELVDARGPSKRGSRARYVRVYTNGGCGGEPTRFVEIGVYGK